MMNSKSIATILFAYAFGLWWYCVPFTGDQKLYLSTAMEMWEHGEWLYPLLHGQHSYYKPPFQYWATLLSWKIFGFGLFGAYFPSALAVVGTATFAGWIARELGLKKSAAPLWFAGCAGTLTYGASVQMEIWIVFFYAGAWALALRYLRTQKTAWLYGAFAINGVAALVKSPLYSAIWIAGWMLYLILSGRSREFLRPRFWGATVLTILIAAPWFIFILLTDRENFWNFYVLRETVSKRGGNGSTIPHLWADFSTFSVPYLFLLPAAWAGLWRKRHSKSKEILFLISYFALPAIFFSLFPYRTETYLYILMPGVAIALDQGLETYSGSLSKFLKWSLRVNGVVVALLAAVVSFLFFRAEMIPLWTAGLILTTGLLFFVRSWTDRFEFKQRLSLAFSGLTLIFMIRMGSLVLGEGDIRGLRQAVANTRASKICLLDEDGNIWSERGLFAIALGIPAVRASDLNEFKTALNQGSLGILNESQASTQLPQLNDRSSQSWWRWKSSLPRSGQSPKREWQIVR